MRNKHERDEWVDELALDHFYGTTERHNLAKLEELVEYLEELEETLEVMREEALTGDFTELELGYT